MAADGSVVVEVIVDQNGVYKGVKSIKNQFGGLEKSVKRLGGIIAGAFGVVAIAKFGKAAIDLGSDVTEVQNVVDVAFGDMSYKMEEFAKTAIQNFGLSTLEAKRTASSFMAMAKGMNFAQGVASDMALALTGLSGDMASFYNITQDEARAALSAVYSGETETLKRYGILITEVNLQEFARQQGITKSINKMTQQEKVMLRYNYIMNATRLSQGDFIRTQDNWANQTRVLSMQWKEFMSIIGQALITILKPLVVVLNQIVSYLITAANAFNVAIQAIFGGSANEIKQTQQNAEAVGGAIAGAVENQEALTDATKGTAKAQKAALAGFDEINKLSSGSSDGGTGGAGVGGIVAGGVEYSISETEPIDRAQLVLFKEQVLATLGDIRENFSLTWSNIRVDFSVIIRNLSELWKSVWGDFSLTVQTFGPQIIQEISSLFNNIWQTGIGPYIQYIVGVWADFTGILLELWNKNGSELLNNIGQTMVNMTEIWNRLYEDILQPIIEPFLETLDWLWKEHISGLVNTVGELVFTLSDAALKIYNNFIAPISKWLMEVFSPAWALTSSLIIGVVGTILGVISDLFNGVLEMLTGIIKFIVGVFTLDWEMAWEGVVSGFKGIFTTMSGIVKGVINVVIDVLNSLIAGLNKINFDVPDWVPLIGGMKWGFNIPEIPKLAQGAVIPPNREFMAVLGDQKSGTNIETPLSTMIEAFTTAMQNMGMGGGQTVVMQIDGREFGRFVNKYGVRESNRIGVNLAGVK